MKINCDKISKHYGKQVIFENFSYCFNPGKIYFLCGRSGSGKTTLLNIICGIENFDNGEISFSSNIKFQKKVDNELMMEKIGYISQNTFFIDYLTILKNLELCCTDDKKIIEYLKKFNLYDTRNKYPNELSGGEKQRIAIIQAVLMNKKVLLLDEPTASLDRENKLKVIKLLNKIKENIIVIMSSHDSELKNNCDEIINLENASEYVVSKNSTTDGAEISFDDTTSRKSILKFMLEQYKYSKFEKKSNFILSIVFVLSILILFLCNSPMNKLLSNIEKRYKINQFKITYSDKYFNEYQELLSDPNVKEIVIDYALNIPITNFNDGFSMKNDDTFYEFNVVTIPYNPEYFKYSKKIIYGQYFEDKNDIIIGKKYALSLANNKDIKSLVGKKISLKLYNGKEEFRIAGIFDDFSEDELMYFKPYGIETDTINEKFFINSKFTENYFSEPTKYILYFKNFKSMNSVFNKYYNNSNEFISGYSKSFYNLFNSFSALSIIMYPVALICIIISFLFYFQSLISRIEYYKYNYCVYNYYRYKSDFVAKNYILANLINICKLLIKSIIFAFIIAILLNYLNDILNIFKFRLFDFNILLLILFVIFIVFICFISMIFISKRIKKIGWYEILQESRDLI